MKHKDLYDQLARLNALMGTDFTMDLGPGGWKVNTGRWERRRPAKEMYHTLDFAIDMIERMKRDDSEADIYGQRGWEAEPYDEAEDDDSDEAYKARDLERFREEENATWYDGECPSCGRDVTPVATRNECECGFRPHPGIEPDEPAKPEELVDCPECDGYGAFEEYEEGRIVFMPCYHCGNTGKVPKGSEGTYECDRCGEPVTTVGSWGDMAERGACATEDGGVLCPRCFAENPTVGLLIEDDPEDYQDEILREERAFTEGHNPEPRLPRDEDEELIPDWVDSSEGKAPVNDVPF